MRVVEPKSFKHKKSIKKKKKPIILILALSIGILLIAFIANSLSADVAINSEISNEESEVMIENPDVSGQVEENNQNTELRQFTDNEFKNFYDNLLQPNLQRVENPPSITGNDIADTRIRKIAEDRGYRLRNSPSSNLTSVDGYLVQNPLVKSWLELKSAATAAGHQLSVVSAYRSVDNQRGLFNSRLSAAGASVIAVANGQADQIVDKVLVTTSIPGYSKHHTGYTIDLFCGGFAFENFENSTCNKWLTADNYKIAKKYGFIPSYPPKADAQGPNPEAWEYVWVGTELLYI